MLGLSSITDFHPSSPHVCPAVEKQASQPSDTDKTNTWIIVGVVVPAVVVIIIISILYWKLCRTDKLEFQPDTMSTVQQRQKVRERKTVWLNDSYVMKCNLGYFRLHYGSSGIILLSGSAAGHVVGFASRLVACLLMFLWYL